MRAVHVHLEGYTAFFRTVWTVTASQLTLPCPPYSTLLGLISACAGKIVTPNDTRIGYEFNRVSESRDLERTNRFELTQGGYLREQAKGKGIIYRQVHFKPSLDLYLTNLNLAECFRNPIATPTLGRSQDICWITKVEEVDLTPVQNGKIGSTMIKSNLIKGYVTPEIVNAVEWFNNDRAGMLREVGNKALFQTISPDSKRLNVEIDNLYHPSNLSDKEDVIYLHQWSGE
jgi:CRISPR-associated protein Cas5t